jgi:ATP-dependent helicase/nuclease subunit A
MSSLVILNASAGSGKTYQIAQQFLKLALKRPKSWQRILAVTFTNKAAAEMRLRILTEVRQLALSPEQSPHLPELIRSTKLDVSQLQALAADMLPEILFRMDRLQVLTLDSFFQLLLRSHARELGLPGGYELQIDTREATQEVVSGLLSSLEPGSPTAMWLYRFIEDRVNAGKNWNVRMALEELAQNLFDEAFQHWRVSMGGGAQLSEQQVQAVILELEAERKELWQTIRDAAAECERIVAESEWKPDEMFKRGGWTVVRVWTQMRSVAWADYNITALRFAESAEEWFAKKSDFRNEGIPWVEANLLAPFRSFIESLELHRNRFLTLHGALKRSHELGLMESLLAQMAVYRQSNNTLLLADAGPILRQVTEGSPLSFIYEKLGNYFNHFMIDEFQDTSRLQWENFNPFIEHGTSGGYKSFLVGDVKQSIYRFRNGDWRLLSYEVAEQYGEAAEVRPLQSNWRSARNVIDFNNELFVALSKRAPGFLKPNDLPEELEERLVEELQRVTQAYADVRQTPGKKMNYEGYVTCNLVEGNKKAEIEMEGFVVAAQLIKEGLERGFRQQDMVVLSRNNHRLNEFGAYLEELRRDGYFDDVPVKLLSDAQFDPMLHPALRILQGVLEFMREAPDPVRMVEADWVYRKELLGESDAIPEAFGNLKQKGLFATLDPLRREFGVESVYHLCHRLIRFLDLEKLEEAGTYLRSFLNLTLEQGGRGKSGLERFLHFWRNEVRPFQPPRSESEDAISAMTFHKAKGLQFPFVIVLMADWLMTELHRESQWLPFDYKTGAPPLMVNITLTKDLARSDFSENYLKAYCDQVLENLNLLYVACTRAEVELHIIIPGIQRDSLSIYRAIQQCLPVLNLEGLEQSDATWSLGSPHPFVPEVVKEKQHIPVIRRNAGKSLAEMVRFHAPRAKEAGMEAIETGRLFHRIMEHVGNKASDLQNALKLAAANGWLEGEGDVELWNTWIEICLNSEGFSLSLGENVRILNEISLLHPELGQRRPDRVFLRPEFTGVIDFKTGTPRKEDTDQLKEYMNVLSEMSPGSVRGWLIYPSLNQEIEVE